MKTVSCPWIPEIKAVCFRQALDDSELKTYDEENPGSGR